jgi:hydrogenase maturation protease
VAAKRPGEGGIAHHSAAHKVLVACIGNPDRGDDGIGARIAQKLEGRLPAGVRLLVRSADMLALIEDFAGYAALICVDAAAPMGEPGLIHRIDLSAQELPRELLSASTHGFGLADALGLAQALERAPRAMVVYAVEGACFDAGAPLTAEVAVAAEEAAAQIAAEAGRLAAQLD